ncbi:hypothetical protein, partial [Proteiniclasticum sp.]
MRVIVVGGGPAGIMAS